MGQLEEINLKVQERVSQRHKEIIISVFANLIKSHNGLCGCNYCEILKEIYGMTALKDSIGKRICEPDYPYHQNMVKDLSDKLWLETRIKELKYQKNNLN